MKMCQAFSDNGHQVVLLTPNLKKNYEADVNDIYKFYGVKKNFNIKKIYHPNFIGGALLYTLGIFIYLLINRNFDLVYGRFLHGIFVASLIKNKVIYETHAPLDNNKNHKLFVFKNLIKNKNFIKMVVISEELKKIYLAKEIISSSKIQVAHDGAEQVKNFENKIDLQGNKENLKVGYVGHLYKGKGMEVISAIADKVDQDVEIHIIGGLEKDLNFWKNKIKKKNIFFYGFVPHSKVSSYINALDVCLLPNQKIVFAFGSDTSSANINISDFTSPLKLFEYMSHKKSIIASDLPVIREVLNETNSILVKHDDFEMWIKSIKKLKNSQYREEISLNALNDFRQYTWINRASLVLRKLIKY
tara:strand:- start:1787 stop:2863 length:1077 start_codon:yes stop_codon:yes gene_type:complete